MHQEDDQPITRILEAAAKGDRDAADHLLPMVYNELRLLARSRLKKLPPGQTLEPTALVHEAYLRVVGCEDPGWDGRGHFFAAAARAMRDILVDQARRKAAVKHGGDRKRVSSEHAEPWIQPPSSDVLAVDEAVKRLEQEDPRKGQIVNLRYFARMSTAETAKAMGLSIGTIEREWRYIRAWLALQLDEGR
jgi:RNA polymerase sigma factor (TIGR02999 family)